MLYEVSRDALNHAGCRRKVRCGLARAASLFAARAQGNASDWMSALDAEDAFHGPPTWVFTVGWGYFTPHEQDVLARWRVKHDVHLAQQWRRDQGQRDKPRAVR